MNTNSCKHSHHKHHEKATPIDPSSIVIIGAGWSGLACAVTLVKQGHKVCLLESARQVGGRAGKISFRPLHSNPMESVAPQIEVDNGQHIMLGAYHYTRQILKQLGQKEEALFAQQSLNFKLYSPDGAEIHLQAPYLPAPLHIIVALLKLKGIKLSERFKAIQFCLKLALKNYKLKQDLSVRKLLKQHQQSPILITTLWEPLCLATLNTPIKYASAKVFLRVLKDSFSFKRSDSDVLFMKQDLSATFCDPAVDYIKQQGSQLLCAHKVTELTRHFSSNTSANPQFSIKIKHKLNNEVINSEIITANIILATPANISQKLLQNMINEQSDSILKPSAASLDFKYEPIYTLYLQYPEQFKLTQRMIGFFNSISQWAIDRSLCQQPGLLAIVISSSGKHQQMSQQQLANTIHQELQQCIPDLPTLCWFRVIKVKKATFSCHVNIDRQRPENQTRIPGLFLAGDYTNTGYPATLEGAIKSGVFSAQHLSASIKK